MGTSRSSERTETWTAGAFIYSGRRDPEWELTPEEGRELADALALLPPAQGRERQAPPLGYRGVWLREPGGREWLVYGGTAMAKQAGRSEHRADQGRGLERRLLASAPAGLLPASPSELSP